MIDIEFVKLSHPVWTKVTETLASIEVLLNSCCYNFSKIALPLTNLLPDDVAWTWGEVQQAAFDALKQALTSEPLLVHAPSWTTLSSLRPMRLSMP